MNASLGYGRGCRKRQNACFNGRSNFGPTA